MSGSGQSLSGLSALKLTTFAKDLRARAAPVLQADPIAIVGMACRVPGAASPEAFWTLLHDKRDATSEIPDDRWNADDWYDPEIATPGKSITRRGGFIDGIDGFDASFFNILPREADAMDPQQRVFLECAIEALDDAGARMPDLRGSRTGVFVASYHSDYQALAYDDLNAIDLRTLTGTVHSVVPNRLSYFLDLRGPSISIDTACSSSLVALHMACQSLRIGESDFAVAGGVSLMVTPDLMVSLSKVGFMAPDGRSKAFDQSADGFGRGEGCGVLALKRLSDAVADGDRVHAVIRGSAVNQDGESTLLTAPNGPAQEALIAEALEAAQVAPDTIRFIEAHGTGTELGDPIEVEAIAATVGQVYPGAPPCYLGTCKANLGHLEAAAGAVGVIKAALVLKHREMPAQPCFETLSPHISLKGTRLEIPRTPLPLTGDTPLRAGISGFGVGGTNAHVILEEAPRLGQATDTDAFPSCPVLPLTARSPEALAAMATQWSAFLATTDQDPHDICYTAAQRRTHHPFRMAVHGTDKAEMAERLATMETPSEPVQTGGKLAFVFCGQGPQWFGMGRELAATSPQFERALTLCNTALQPYWDHDLITELGRSEEDSRLGQTEIAQPALFSIHVALAAMWRSRGIEPHAVVGHSIGEIAALHVAGILDLDSAARVVCHRARLMQRADGLGAMAAVRLSAEALRPYLADASTEDLSIAAINAPQSCVLSGTEEAISAISDKLAAQDVSVQRLPVRYAFHSAQMDVLLPDLRAALANVAGAPPRIPVYSTVTGDALTEAVNVDYFCKNVRQPVRFADAIAALSRDGFRTFLEIGPHPVLAGSIGESADPHVAKVIATLRRGRPDTETVATATASLFASGSSPDWSVVAPEGAVVSLPGYPWQHRRHWLAARAKSEGRLDETSGLHPLLARHQHVAALNGDLFEGSATSVMHWMSDHKVFGHVLLPGTAILDALAAAAAHVLGPDVDLRDVVISAPVDLEPHGSNPVTWQVTLTRTPGGGNLVWHSWDGEGWTSTATARADQATGADLPTCPQGLPSAELGPDNFTRTALDFGPAFQRLRDIAMAGSEAVATLDRTDIETGFGTHPALLDAGFQLASVLADGTLNGPELAAFLPLGVDRFRVLKPGEPAHSVWVRLRETSDSAFAADIVWYGASGAPCAEVTGARFVRAVDMRTAGLAAVRSYVQEWVSVPETSATASVSGDWVLVDLGRSQNGQGMIAKTLQSAGGTVFQVSTDGNSTADVEIDPSDFAQADALCSALRERAVNLRQIVLCCGLDAATSASDKSSWSEHAQGTVAALHFCNAVLRNWPEAPPRLTLMTRGAQVVVQGDPGTPDCAAIAGLLSSLALEHPELQPRSIDLDPYGTDSDLLSALMSEAPFQTALRGADLMHPALQNLPTDLDNGPQRLETNGENTAEGVELRPAPSPRLKPDDVRIDIRASGVNFRDVLSALGMYPGAPVPLGNEAAGVVLETGSNVTGIEVGQRVMGLMPWSHATEAVTPAHMVVAVPETLSDVQAAATPVAFLTAAYGLHHLARLKQGETVLIHAAAGGVGMAAVHLALQAGATVYATAGSDRKRAYLRDMGVAGVFGSRDLEFVAQLRAATQDRGVDVVLNSLADAFIPASMDIVAPSGRFLELGKRGILSNDEAHALRPDVTYHAFDLGTEALDTPGLVAQLFAPVAAGFADGSLRPLPVQEFPLRDAAQAFRYMAQARHLGKIVLRTSHPPFRIDPAASYWITGGLGAVGLDTVRWLIAKGARRIALSGRSAPKVAITADIEALRASGAEILLIEADAGDPVAMAAALEKVRALGPLKGVVHAAGVLRDTAFSQLTSPQVRDVFHGKVEGAHILDRLTAGLNLDFFLLYSGAGLILGSPGQAAYCAANAALDALARRRRASGLPATCLSFGPWQGAGMAQDLREDGRDIWGDRGVPPISPDAAFEQAEALVASGCPWAMVASIDWPQFLSVSPEAVDRDYFASLATPKAAATTPTEVSTPETLIDSLRATPMAMRSQAMLEALSDMARTTIGLTASTIIAPASALKEVGLDSLMAVEFRNTLVRAGNCPLPVTLLFDHPTLDTLAGKLADLWKIPLSDQSIDAPDQNDTSDLDDLSDEDALAMLQAELARSDDSDGPDEEMSS